MKYLALLLLLSVHFHAMAEDWPQFLGPKGDGHYSGAKLPTEWGVDKNVAWKTPLPGKGWSSPIIVKGKIYLTTAVAAANGDQSLRAICLDQQSGSVLWDHEIFKQAAATAPKIHAKNSHASPTPVSNGELIFVHFGHSGTAALDKDGKVVWQRTGIYSKPVHGNGGSPILVGKTLVFSCDAADKQIVIALDQLTGKTVWETPRNNNAKMAFSFATPHVTELNGKPVILSSGSDIMAAYNPDDGKEIWRTKFVGWSLIQKPTVGHGMVYYSTGYMTPVLHAVKLNSKGDVTDQIVWTVKKSAPNTPSLLLVGNELYMLADSGMLTCLDAKTGEVIYAERMKGQYSASMLYADGNIYMTSELGSGSVVKAGREFKLLGEYDLKEKTFASPVGVDGELFIRTESQLYKFVNSKK